MCRYAMATYKPHYACFNCRKTFKRRLLSDIQGGYSKDDIETIAKCPECSGLMANMGLDFESPKKNDIKTWKHIATLYKVDITFHSCGCNGPGYIPNNSKDLLDYFLNIKQTYIDHQRFWARRKKDPDIQSTIAKDQHKNVNFIYNLQREMHTGTRNKPTYDASKAQKYWNDKIQSVEEKINVVSKEI